MIDESKVESAIAEFCKNEGWKKIFEAAPAGAMERMAISFYFSENNKDFTKEDFAEYRALRDEIEKTLDKEDLEYLIANIKKDGAVENYKELLKELEKNGGKPQGSASISPGEEQPESGTTEEPPAEQKSSESTETAQEKPE